MSKEAYIVIILLIPLLGTILGSVLVYFTKGLNKKFEKIMLGFASGFMIAASVFSLLLPSIEQSSNYGTWNFVPPLTGFVLGILMMLGLDYLLPHLHPHKEEAEGYKPKREIPRSLLIATGVSLHNFPEGLAVGVSLLGALSGNETLTFMGALTLALGIAIQNFPEGAIISIPLSLEGYSKTKSFLIGALSGVVELLAALIALAFMNVVSILLPYLLSFAAGAMIYIVIEELLPEATKGEHSNLPTLSFALGFIILLIMELTLN